MDTAYANIGLDANTIWRDAPGDGFQKNSDKLWVKLNYLKEKKHHQVGEKGKVVTVHDVIPQSRLAVYGNYSYDNDREMMYNREKPLQFSEEVTKTGSGATEEPWMMTEVEQEFRRLTRNCSQPYDLYNGFKPIDCVEVEESIQKKYPVLAKKCQPHTIDTEETLEAIYLPNPFYRIDDLNQLELQMRITSTKHIWEHPMKNLISLLNTDKYSEHLRCPTFSEVDYSSERNNLSSANQPSVFPLPPPSIATSQSPPSPTPFVSSFRLIESLGDLNVRRSFRTSSRTSQLVEGRTELLPVVKKRSSAEHHHDFTNLTLLTRPINLQESSIPDQQTFQVPETVLKWLQTGYPTRSKEFSAIQNLSDELRNVRTGLQCSGVSNFAREKPHSDYVGVKKYELNPGSYPSAYSADGAAYRSETLTASLASNSSSEQNRPKLGPGNGKLQISRNSNLSYTAVSSSSLTGAWQAQASSLWSSKPFNLLGLAPSDFGFTPDNAFQRFAGKPAKCRPILNSQYKEVADEDFGFEQGDEKKRVTGGMADMRTLQCYAESSFDDLERQAIEQWPSEDRMDIFCSKHLQKYGIYHYESWQLILVPDSDATYRNFSQGEGQRENKLQDKLRILLDFDSFDGSESKKNGREVGGRDGAFDKSTCFQHKSLPDLSLPQGPSSSESSDSSFGAKCDGNSRSGYSSRTQPEASRFLAEKCADCRRFARSTKTFCGPEFPTRPRIYSSFRATKSGEFFASKPEEGESSCRRRSSNTSSCNRSRHNSSSKHSQSADSGRQSQGGSIGLRTGRSGLPEFCSPPPNGSWTDSGTEDDSPPLFRAEGCDGDKKRPILRSKSDITYKYCASKPKLMQAQAPAVQPALPTTEKLEFFFDHLGMDPCEYKELASNSRNSSPVFFSSVSSIDSCVDLTVHVPEPCKATECPSIVERNARIIKWLYNCRKFQKTLDVEARTQKALN